MTRHLYDISKLMETEHVEKEIANKELCNTIIEHKSKLTRVSWVDYKNHSYESLNFIPLKEIIADYERDYEAMRESMFYG